MDKAIPGSTTLNQSADDWPDIKEKSALKTLWEHRELVLNLTSRDIRSRYKQSVLGIAWALLTPVAMTAVFTVVMSYIAKVNTGKIPYPIFAYIAMLPWTFFSGALTTGTECLVSNFNLITKIYFPREVFPISVVLGKTVDLGLGILVLIPLFLIYGIKITPWILLLFPILFIQTILLIGLTFIFSTFNLFYRDVRHVMPLLVQIWMYMTPIIYPLEMIPDRFFGLYMLNPMASIMDSFRKVALLGEAPMWGYLAYSTIISVLVLIIGYRIIKKYEPAFAELI